MTSRPWPPQGKTPPYAGGHRDAGHGDTLSLIKLINLLLKRRRMIVMATVLTLAATVLVTFLTPRTYSSSVAFVPQERSQTLADLTGFVGAPGFLLPAMSSQSSAFYADLLNSDELLRTAILTDYEINDELADRDSSVASGTLIEYFGVEGDNPDAAAEKAMIQLEDRVSVRTDRETGVVRYSVTTRSPDLSRQIAERLFSLVNEFDLERRQSQASAERRFIEARLDSARADVRAAENRLERFLAGNRNFGSSPSLVFQHDRLQRDVSFNQQVLGSLAEAFERARIEEVRNTPVLTIVDHARASRLPDPRQLVLKTLVAILAGLAIGVGAALWSEFMARSQVVEPDAYDEFVSLKQDAFARVRGLLPGHGKGTIKSD